MILGKSVNFTNTLMDLRSGLANTLSIYESKSSIYFHVISRFSVRNSQMKILTVTEIYAGDLKKCISVLVKV